MHERKENHSFELQNHISDISHFTTFFCLNSLEDCTNLLSLTIVLKRGDKANAFATHLPTVTFIPHDPQF